jgi:hypothetical protein
MISEGVVVTCDCYQSHQRDRGLEDMMTLYLATKGRRWGRAYGSNIRFDVPAIGEEIKVNERYL